MKGQKSSDRLSVDESKWSVAKRLSIVKCLYSCRQSQSFLTLEFTISNHVPLVIIQDMLLIYREKHNYIK